MKPLAILLPALILGLLAFPISATATDNEGQEDLDKATELKIEARTLQDLQKVAELCESAIKKGLDEANTQFAEQLITASLFQRAQQVGDFVKRRQRGWRSLRQIATSDLEKVIKYDVEYGEAYLLLAELLAIPGGDRKKAKSTADLAIKHLANDKRKQARAYMVRAQLQEKPEDVIADLEKSANLDPENQEPLQLRAMYLLDQEEYDKAVAAIKELLKADENNAAMQLALVEALINMEKYDEALEQAKRAIEISPDMPMPYTMRARIYTIKDDLDSALADLNKALRLQPRDLNTRMFRARLHHAAGNYKDARRDVNRVLQEVPDATEAILLRTMIAAAEGKFYEAIADTEALVARDPENMELKVQLGLFHLADDRPRKSIKIFSEVVDADEGNWRALRGRADANLGIGEHGTAIEDYEAAVKAQPEDSGILNNFAWVLATSPDEELRDGKRSIELGIKACELTDYKAAHILSTLAAGYAEIGDFETAIKWSTKAVELGEGDSKEQLQEELDSYNEGKPWREKTVTKEKPEFRPDRNDTDT